MNYPTWRMLFCLKLEELFTEEFNKVVLYLKHSLQSSEVPVVIIAQTSETETRRKTSFSDMFPEALNYLKI